MTVDFNDYFWGEKNNGFDVLYHNMKYGLVASKDFAELLRERSNIEENNSKLLSKFAKQAGSCCNQGTFAPLWQVLKTSAERLSVLHMQMVQKVTDLVKEVNRYSEELHKKHKTVKEDESGTLESVQAMQNVTLMVQKCKDTYTQRGLELEKLRKDNASPKEIEKADLKLKKAQEEYKSFVEKYTVIKEDFEKKMSVTCKNFQELEVAHLVHMKEFFNSYAEVVEWTHEQMGKVHKEFRQQCIELTVDQLLEQFVRNKSTGLERPGRLSQAVCYFPQQFQGEFVMQTTTNLGTGVQYTTVNITSTSIPIWGTCHRRKGNNNFVLMLNFRETSCIRCLHLKLRSANVLQVFTLNQEIISKCYTNEKLAEENCPSEESLANREAAEILLFKRNGYYTRKEYCPIDGKYAITYRNNNPTEVNQCTGFDSTMDSCPSGSILNFRLRGCTTNPNNFDLRFECMASWKGPNNENFLIFADNNDSNKPLDAQKPKYRCALYHHEYRTDEIQMALSRDSTCTSDLINSTHGFETFMLTARAENPWPAEASFGTCSFPKWMHGTWEHVRVDDDTMIYKDHSSFKTYTIKCVGVQEDGNKYLVFSRTQCDEERYNCMRIVERSDNIMEFQLGSNASTTKDVFGLCSEDNFQDDSWITQGRTDALDAIPSGRCPISGEYVGVIPDGEDLCAKLWSDCDTSELMYYQVSHCKTNEIYEEREYKCLGHWRESEFLYTYTQRRDVAAGTYECFVGVKMSNREIYIKEAGEHCQRHIDPLHYGMQLNKTSLYTCNYTTPRNTPRTSTRMPDPRRPPVSTLPTVKPTTKVWNFDTAGAETKNNDNASSATILQAAYLTCIFVYIIKYFM